MAIALVDVNNFYASCEAAVSPRAAWATTGGALNNDGCVVSRSYRSQGDGASRWGALLSDTASRLRRMAEVAFSSIMPSMVICRAEVMSTLEIAWPELEVYSIDETFLALSASFAGDLYRLWAADPPAGAAVDRPHGRGRHWPHQDPPPNWPTMPPKSGLPPGSVVDCR